VRYKIIFAISLALTHPILSLPDADLPQFAQNGGMALLMILLLGDFH